MVHILWSMQVPVRPGFANNLLAFVLTGLEYQMSGVYCSRTIQIVSSCRLTPQACVHSLGCNGMQYKLPGIHNIVLCSEHQPSGSPCAFKVPSVKFCLSQVQIKTTNFPDWTGSLWRATPATMATSTNGHMATLTHLLNSCLCFQVLPC